MSKKNKYIVQKCNHGWVVYKPNSDGAGPRGPLASEFYAFSDWGKLCNKLKELVEE